MWSAGSSQLASLNQWSSTFSGSHLTVWRLVYIVYVEHDVNICKYCTYYKMTLWFCRIRLFIVHVNHRYFSICIFLSRDAMQSAVMPHCVIRMSICLSVTFTYVFFTTVVVIESHAHDVLVCVMYVIWLVLSNTYHFFDSLQRRTSKKAVLWQVNLK